MYYGDKFFTNYLQLNNLTNLHLDKSCIMFAMSKYHKQITNLYIMNTHTAQQAFKVAVSCTLLLITVLFLINL